METYKASLDTFSKIITGFIFLMFPLGIGIMLTQTPWYGGLVITIIPLLVLVPTYIYSVASYQIKGENLIIKRPFPKFDKEIAFSEIESITIPDKDDFKWTIRTFGDGGLFGYYGIFANPKLGSFRVYATRRANRILIVLKSQKEKIVISPDDPGMADTLQKQLKKGV